MFPKQFDRVLASLNEALYKVDRAASDLWKAEAMDALLKTAASGEEFMAEDVWASGLLPPREARALGPVFLRAKRAGDIKITRIGPSKWHMTPRAVWRKA